MGDTSIRVSTAAKERLELYKREGESFDDVIMRLTTSDKWSGFGVASGDPEAAREGMAEVRRSLREGLEADVEELRDARPGQ